MKVILRPCSITTLCLAGTLLDWGLPAARAAEPAVAGELIMFHAGSLAVPMAEMVTAFNALYPDVRVLREAAGSVACARKITELGQPCDVLASADYEVINRYLVPAHSRWAIPFAANEMVLTYTDRSRHATELCATNWGAILLRDDVVVGRSDPNSDPCGYRTVLTLKLAGLDLWGADWTTTMLAKDREFMRPKETDLLALLESGEVDYGFLYRSLAIQHQLRFLELPAAVNLGTLAEAASYARVSVDIAGSQPGATETMRGEPMVYGITIPTGAPNPAAALAFVRFLLSPAGRAVMERNGQPSVVPAATVTYADLPPELQEFARPPQ